MVTPFLSEPFSKPTEDPNNPNTQNPIIAVYYNETYFSLIHLFVNSKLFQSYQAG